MDQTNHVMPDLGTPKTLPLPPFATATPAFVAVVAGGVAFAFGDPAGGTCVSVLDAQGRWGPKMYVALSAIGMASCGEALILGGLRLPDGALVLMGVARGALAWTIPLHVSGRRIHGPFPVCDSDIVNGVWVTEDAEGRATLWAAQVSNGEVDRLAGIQLESRPLEIDVAADRDVPVAVWTAGPRLAVSGARVEADSASVFQNLEGAASPRFIRTPGGLAWIAVGPKGLRAQRMAADLAPVGAPIDLGDGFAPILVAQTPGRAVLFARGLRSFTGTVEIPGPDPREEPVYTAEAWAAGLDLTSLTLGPRTRLTSFSRYLAAAFAPGALIVIHGEGNFQLSAFALP